jgi:hypothetical protein
LEELIEHVGFAPDHWGHAGSQGSFLFIKEQVENCLKNHQCSRLDPPLAPLPDRVIWLNSPHAPDGIQLIEPQGTILAPYLALSYCWGPVSATTFLTSPETLAARKAGINYDDLPLLFQNVVTVCRALGFQYLWIDRLCIIQGVTSDFDQQAPKMGDIYGNAAMTIASASATTENDRILTQRDDKWRPRDLDISVGSGSRLGFFARRRSHKLGSESQGGDYGRISTRAWAWQERLLSARTVFFTPSALKFECRAHSVWEGFGPGVTGPSRRLEDVTGQSWLELVEEFTEREVTKDGDRWVIMHGIMARISDIKGWKWVCGLREGALVEDLCWKAAKVGVPLVPCRMNDSFYAPTWSWLGIVGTVSYLLVRTIPGMEETDPAIHELQVKGFDSNLAVLVVEGRVVTREMSCEVRECDAEEPGGEKRLVYTYKVLDLDPTSPLSITADVDLEPWAGLVHGQTFSTVVRSPSGKMTSWIGNCRCLLVSRRQLRSSILVLGQSRRVPGAWERLGMVTGLDPAFFPGMERQVLTLA